MFAAVTSGSLGAPGTSAQMGLTWLHICTRQGRQGRCVLDRCWQVHQRPKINQVARPAYLSGHQAQNSESCWEEILLERQLRAHALLLPAASISDAIERTLKQMV